jgi:hypothetical protein
VRGGEGGGGRGEGGGVRGDWGDWGGWGVLGRMGEGEKGRKGEREKGEGRREEAKCSTFCCGLLKYVTPLSYTVTLNTCISKLHCDI